MLIKCNNILIKITKFRLFILKNNMRERRRRSHPWWDTQTCLRFLVSVRSVKKKKPKHITREERVDDPEVLSLQMLNF